MCTSVPTPPPVIPPAPPEAVSNLMLGSQSRTIQARQLNTGRDTVRSSLGMKQAVGVSKGTRSAKRGNQRLESGKAVEQKTNARYRNRGSGKVVSGAGGRLRGKQTSMTNEARASNNSRHRRN